MTLTLDATFGSSNFQEQDSDDVITDTRTRDFIITQADFVATFEKPKEGDLIELTEGEEKLVFEVKAPAGTDVYENDNYRLSFRIHAQLTGEGSVSPTWYHGVGAAGLTPAQIMALSNFTSEKANKTVSESPTVNRFYYAYQASFGTLDKILDPNGFDLISDYTFRVEDFSGVDYNIYEYGHDTTQTSFALSYNF